MKVLGMAFMKGDDIIIEIIVILFKFIVNMQDQEVIDTFPHRVIFLYFCKFR